MTQKEEERIMAEIRSRNILDRKDFNALKDSAVKASKNDCQMELIASIEEIRKHFSDRKKFMMKEYNKLSKENQKIIQEYINEDNDKMKNFERQFDVS
jgi:inorganic pyrophosphatase